MKIFADRSEAGKQLARLLPEYQNRLNTIVLALPRGGVTVAFEVARNLNLPLEVFLVRKLGAPANQELAIGAIAENDSCVFNQDLIQELGVTQHYIDEVMAQEKLELARRMRRYRGGQPLLNISQQQVILVDDGIATGATTKAAIIALQQLQPASITLAVAVAPAATVASLKDLAINVVCPYMPEPFYGVGMWYGEFPQVTDEAVCDLLASAKIRKS